MNSVLFVLLGLFLGASAQSCWIEGHRGESTIALPPLAEDTPADTAVATFQLVNHLTTSTVSDPFTKYLSALRYANGIYIVSTTAAFPDFVTTERVTELARTFSMTCVDGTVVRTTLLFPVPDLNNHAPTWNQDSYDVTIALPLNPTTNFTLVRTNVVVSDGDVDFETNADVYITSSSRNFVASITPSTGETSYDWQVDFLVDVTTSAGNYMTMLTADDGTHFTTAIVRFTVLPPGDPEPEPTEEPSTEEPETEEPATEDPVVTTEEPVTEEPEVTTEDTVTEEPATEEPITEEPIEETPEPEPTVEGPSTTTTEAPTTTTTTQPTTPAPSHTCGLTGLDPDNTWGLAQPLHPALPPGTEIWRHPLYNVVSTTAVNHAHNKYISAYRGSLTYWFTTNDFYQSFIEEQGTNIIERRVNFYCEDGSVVQYHFMLEIDNTPIEEDTLPPLFKVWA